MKRTIYAALAATVALPMLAVPAGAQQGQDYGYGQSGDPAYQWSERRGGGMPARDAYAGEGRAPNPPRTPERYITDWDQAGQGRNYPRPPYTPDRYVTDWNDDRRAGGPDYPSERYGADWNRPGYGDRGPGWRPMADDRWANRDAPRRDFDRPNPPPGYDDDRGGYDEGKPRFRAHSGQGWYDDDRHAGYGRDDMHPYDRGGHDRGWRDERRFDPYARRGWGGDERFHQAMRSRHHGYEDMDFRRDFSQDGRRGYYQDPSYEDMPRDRRGRGMQAGPPPEPDMRQVRRAMRMIDRFDVDGDNRVTQEEVDQYRSDRLNQFDTDSDRQLTLEEYSALWSDAMRENMVRRFQSHDSDGDGVVTEEEFAAQSRDMVRMRDRDRDAVLTERDFRRPVVEAPMGGAPNEPAESRVEGDDDVADYDTRPEVEAPMGDQPNEPAGPAADEETGAMVEPATGGTDSDDDTTN